MLAKLSECLDKNGYTAVVKFDIVKTKTQVLLQAVCLSDKNFSDSFSGMPIP